MRFTQKEVEAIRFADGFATAAHMSINQKRKYSDEPYYEHPRRVAKAISASNLMSDVDTVVGALLHDVVEDTPVTIEQVEAVFGVYVAGIVKFCTHKSVAEDGNRQTRKAIDRQHYAQGNFQSQTIKVYDMIDNITDLCEHDVDFAIVYIKEKMDLLEALSKIDDSTRAMAQKFLTRKEHEVKTQKYLSAK